MDTVCLVILSALATTVYSSCIGDVPYDWSYENPGDWEDKYPNCGKEKQSPIDLYGDECENSKQPVVTVVSDEWPVTVWNDGRTLKLKFDCYGETGPLKLRFSHSHADADSDPEELDYDLAELHFHWGKKHQEGSEHAIEDERYAAEAHLKFKHPEYATFEHAKGEEGKLYAVGVLLTENNEEEEEDSDSGISFPTFGLENIMKKVSKFNSIHRMYVNVRKLKKLLDRVLQSVYKYTGSLTTPPCTLNLPWLVSTVKTPISRKFLKGLRKKLFDENGKKIVNNFRPIQERDEHEVCLHEGENDSNGQGYENNGFEGSSFEGY